MRGKAEIYRRKNSPSRITPAYAGKRWTGETATVNVGDHPRLCGEKFTKKQLADAIGRITPAYAGKSTGRHHRESRKQDHPRLCGEKLLQRSRLDSLVGSPPPMRGKGPEDRCRSAGHGITPAYAGKSMTRFTLHRHTTDHPRLCGEKLGL